MERMKRRRRRSDVVDARQSHANHSCGTVPTHQVEAYPRDWKLDWISRCRSSSSQRKQGPRDGLGETLSG